MRHGEGIPQRRGVVVNLTLSPEAHKLLPALASGRKSQGHFLSGLIVREIDQRRLRQEWAAHQAGSEARDD